jgi:hypothetical protein
MVQLSILLNEVLMAEFMLMLIAESMEELMDFEIKHIFNLLLIDYNLYLRI